MLSKITQPGNLTRIPSSIRSGVFEIEYSSAVEIPVKASALSSFPITCYNSSTYIFCGLAAALFVYGRHKMIGAMTWEIPEDAGLRTAKKEESGPNCVSWREQRRAGSG